MLKFLAKFRLLFALFLLAALLHIVHIQQVLDALSHIRLKYIAALVVLTVVLIWISCVKWQMFIRATGHDAAIIPLMKYYTMSYFFNMFLPSSLGGDMARSIQLGIHLKSYKSAFAATFVERLTGFLAMILMGVSFVAIGSHATAGVEAAVLFVAFFSVLGALVCFSRTLSGFCFSLAVTLCRRLGLRQAADKLDALFQKVTDSIEFARHDSRLFGKAMILSLLFHLLAVVNAYVCALAVGWQTAEFGSLCMVVPLVLLVSIAPITPSSIGIQEGAFLFFLMRVGATQGEGLGVAFLLRAKVILTACVGGMLWLISRNSSGQKALLSAAQTCQE